MGVSVGAGLDTGPGEGLPARSGWAGPGPLWQESPGPAVPAAQRGGPSLTQKTHSAQAQPMGPESCFLRRIRS